jgi:Mor family transcriptional regulator
MAHAVVNELLEVRGAPRYSPEMKRQLKDEYSSTNTSISALSQKYAVSERTIGRIISGEIEPKTKLSRSDVVLIIELRRDGNTLKSISEKFSCGISQIHRITRGESRNVQYERESL